MSALFGVILLVFAVHTGNTQFQRVQDVMHLQEFSVLRDYSVIIFINVRKRFKKEGLAHTVTVILVLMD
jgi:hypothetical protein